MKLAATEISCIIASSLLALPMTSAQAKPKPTPSPQLTTSLAGSKVPAHTRGHEIDITVRTKLLKWVSLQAGYGVLLPLQGLGNLKGAADNTDHWFYAHTNITF